MHASLLTADRATHLRIVVVGMGLSLIVVWLALALH
jgi:hypothetical protein